MVTKSKKKHMVFSKKYTRKNNYFGGDTSKSLAQLYKEIADKNRIGSKLTEEIRQKSMAEAKAQYFAQSEVTGIPPEDWARMKADYYAKSKVTGMSPEVSATDSTMSPEESSTTDSVMSPQIQIPSFVDEDLFIKTLASNVDFLIEQSLESNDFDYILEKQREQQEEVKQADVKQADYLPILNKRDPKVLTMYEMKQQQQPWMNPMGNMMQRTNMGYGGSKYFKYNEDKETAPKKWVKIFKKFKDLQNVFYKTGEKDDRRSDEIKRFNLYLEMMDFYKHVIDKLKILKLNKDYSNFLQTYYNNSSPQEKTAIGDTDIVNKILNISIIQGDDEEKGNAKEGVFFVRFVLFNDSITNLFTQQKTFSMYTPEERNKREAAGDPIKKNSEKIVNVNIFQLSQTTGLIYGSNERQSAEDTNRTLTTSLPAGSLVPAGFNPSNFYTQFKTFQWSLEFIDNNFFKNTRRTGDNISVLVRSTILYVIAKIFNDTTVKNYINGGDINKYYSESNSSTKFLEILRTAFPTISVGFLSELANSYLPITYQKEGLITGVLRTFRATADINKEWKNQLQQIKNFITASKYKKNEDEIKKETENQPEALDLEGHVMEEIIDEFDDTKSAIPYNVFVNLYKRSDDPDKLFLTNIPDNIINSDALIFVNSLELFLTNNEYLSETTKNTIKTEFKNRGDDYTSTKNIFHTSNEILSTPLKYIGVSNHKNPEAIKTQITEFDSHTIKELKLDTIEADIKDETMNYQSKPLDFKINLKKSQDTFNSPCCDLSANINNELGGFDNATIDSQRACLMSQLVYENTKVVRLFDFENCWERNETLRKETIQVIDYKNPGVKIDKTITKGLKYLCAYQPDYQYGAYKEDMAGVPLNRFNNEPYIQKKDSDNLQLVNYDYVEHKCHVWVDDDLKRVYVVFRGTVSSHDWYITDIGISAGFGFQEGRLLQIKEILRDIYRQLNTYAMKYKGDKEGKPEYADGRQDYKVIFAGHSLGGFLSIMSSVMVFNNKLFKYKNTFQNAISITFNPWFPPEAIPSRSQGVLDSYIPLINYGTTCALAFGICGDAAQRTLIPSCSSSIEGFEEEDEDSFEAMMENPLARGIRTTVDALSKSCGIANINPVYFNQVKGPFYYYLVDSWATTSIKNVAPRHSVHNFFGVEIQKKLLDFTTNYVSLYNDLPENINKKNNYLDMLFSELNKPANNRRCLRAIPLLGIQVPGSQLTQPSQSSSLTCGLNVTTNIVLGGNYRLPVSPAIPFNSGMINLNPRDAIKSNVTVTVNPSINNVPDTPSLGGKKYKTVVKKTSKKLRKRRSKRTTKKLRR